MAKDVLDITPSNSKNDIHPDQDGSDGNLGTPYSMGVLEPPSGLLPSGTSSITLRLITPAAADCRWNHKPNTPYENMQNEFQQGQGTQNHSVVVSGIQDLDNLWFYVRCQDLSTGRNPDSHEWQTNLRVLGPWGNGYPRIANLWALESPGNGSSFFTGYDLLIPYYWENPIIVANIIRTANPNAKILQTQEITHGRPETDPLADRWWNSSPGNPDYNCFLRDSKGNILLVDYWGHPMYNMTAPYCRQVLAQKSVDDFLASQPGQGAYLIYDGIYWDLLHDHISWLSDDVDSDLNGKPDDPAILDEAFQTGVKDFLSQVRDRLPNAILVGNEASPDYANWINGRLFEWQLSAILDGAEWLTWDSILDEYRNWTIRGQVPHTTFIQSAPESLFSRKYTNKNLRQMPEAMLDEAAASYQRMRFGLTTALMGDGLFSFDYGPNWHGNLWWYDEYGAFEGEQDTKLPPRGYLGQPVGDPMQLVAKLSTPGWITSHYFIDGEGNGEVWRVAQEVQPGALGVWARAFENGLAVVNPTNETQVIPLPGVYCKLNGKQAPLFQIRVDDDEAQAQGDWIQEEANFDQFGATVQIASAETTATITYTPTLAYSGEYEVLAWVAPSKIQSKGVTISIQHTKDQAQVILDETVGDIGWHSLGTYAFEAGQSGSAKLVANGHGRVVVDAFKWVSTARYNDGNQVSEITLQPRDGMILLSSCYKP